MARVIEEAADLGPRGVTFGKPKLDLDKIRGFKLSVVDRLTKGLGALAKQRQVEVVQGEGRFTSANTTRAGRGLLFPDSRTTPHRSRWRG